MQISLTNITIRKLQDKNFNDYYLIKDEGTDVAYFCFDKSIKTGWDNLLNNWENASECELEYDENERGQKKVVAIINIK